jgi:PIN domain nuclease of toxin-antitoxin system
LKLLLDTHIFIWVVSDDAKLSTAAWALIETADAVYVSSASIWEATIKYQLGKLSLDPSRLVENVAPSGFLDLPISLQHAAAVGRLPLIHRDPFDRLLLAQAISEPLHLVTADETLSRYSELVHHIEIA